MSSPMHTPRLIERIRRRMWAAQVARRSALVWWWSGGAFLGTVLLGRCCGFGSTWLGPAAIAVPVLIALGSGLALARTPDRQAAARRADAALGGDDLLLTACSLPPAATGFATVVIARAETRAATADPARVVPWQPWRRSAWSLVVAVAALALALWMPQADPFGIAKRQALAAERQRSVEEARAAAVARAAEIAAQRPDAPLSAATEKALAELLAVLPKAGRDSQNQRLAALDAERRKISAALDATDAERTALPPADQGLQRIGAATDPAAAAALRQALERGDATAAQQAAQAAIAAVKKLEQAATPAERLAAERELGNRLAELAQAAGSSKDAAQALADAAARLADTADPALAKEALEALAADLQLSEEAMGKLAQTARDREAMRAALDALRLARAAALAGKWGVNEDPASKGVCDSVEAYRKMYRRLADGSGEGEGDDDDGGNGKGNGGNGKGLGGKGHGSGGKAPEDPSVVTDNLPENSPSRSQPGKIVASWKAPGASEPGTVVEAYREQLQAARREAADEVISEDLPPAYREAAKRYFDGLANGAAKP